ncbi:MAG: NAD(P)-dependent oxidoreductase, partial [Phototrophicales bacterium]
ADLIMTMLAHPQAVESIALGDNGFLPALSEGKLWIDCSTVNPSFSKQMAEQALAHGNRFLDAPVAGSKNQAQDGVLAFIVGGDASDVEEATPLFEIMGSRVVHVGGHGMGTSLKIVVN